MGGACMLRGTASAKAYRQMETEYTALLVKILRDSRIVDLEALCLRAGEEVRTVSCEISVLNHDGNLLDACFLACLSALKHYKHEDGEDGRKALMSLSIPHTASIVTFARFDSKLTTDHPDSKGGDLLDEEEAHGSSDNNEKIWVLDATKAEEMGARGFVHIAMDKYKQVLGIFMTEGCSMTLQDYKLLIQIATRVTNERIEIMEAELAVDHKKGLEQVKYLSGNKYTIWKANENTLGSSRVID